MFRPFGTSTAATPTASNANNPGTPGFTGFGTPQPQPPQQQLPVQPLTFGGFGQPSTSTGGLFGAGGGGGALQTTPLAGPPPPYTTTTELENNVNIQLVSIAAMPFYRNRSPEEIRLTDYQQGRKGATGFGGGSGVFGAFPSAAPSAQPYGGFSATSTSLGFGAPAAATPAQGGFGFGGSTFGGGTGTGGLAANSQPPAAPLQPPSQGAFGGFGTTTTPAPPLFGASGSNLFGANTNLQQQQQQQPAPTVSFGFGTNVNPTPNSTQQSSLFGGFSKPANTTGGSLFSFGTSNQPAQAAPAFGQTTTQPAASLNFQAPQPAPAPTQQQQQQPFSFSFGSQPAAASTGAAGSSFLTGGATLTTAPAPTNAPSLFPSATQQSAPALNLFPSTQSNMMTQPQQQQQPQTSFLFNNTQTALAQPQSQPFQLQQQAPSNLPLVNSASFSLKPPLPAGLAVGAAVEASVAVSKTPSLTFTGRNIGKYVPRGSFKLGPPPSGMIPTTTINVKKLVVLPPTSESSITEFSQPISEVEADGELDGLWIQPSRAALARMSYSQQCSVANFTIGKKGVGQVRFLRPIDMTAVDLEDLPQMVIFEPRQVTIYPEDRYISLDEEFEKEKTEKNSLSDDRIEKTKVLRGSPVLVKPPPGQGLNQPAEIRLEGCWPISKATREPIRDVNMGSERMRHHVARLKAVPDTKFQDFLPETGTWVFTVEHFSHYGMQDDDDEADNFLSRGDSTTSHSKVLVVFDSFLI